MKKVLVGLFVVFCLVTSSLLVAPFSVSAEEIYGFDYDNYYQLEYIEAVNGAYIDTSYKGNNTTYIESKVRQITNNTNPTINPFGDNTVNTRAISVVIPTNTTGRTSRFGSWNGVYNSTPFNLNTDYKITIDNIALYVNSNKIFDISGSGTFTNNANIYLFHSNGNTSNFYDGRIRMYYTYIKDDGYYVRKFIPCERKSDNALGMYDTVNRSFYSKQGSGSFVGGPRVAVTQYTITTNVSPTGSGNVTGGGIYDSGTIVTLTAVPETGYTFDHWNNGSVQNPLTITATSNMTYTAYFVGSSPPQTQYTITTNVSPSGSGTVSGGGTYSSGTTVTLSAVPNNGYIFSQWSDGVTSASRQIIVNADSTYTAIFEEIPPTYYTVTTNVSPSGSGTVTGSGSYLSGTYVTLSAVASNGYRFSSWSDGNSDNPRTIVLTSDFNITAYFVDESIISNIVVGYNVNVIDFENHYITQSMSGTARDRLGNGEVYDINVSLSNTLADTTYIYQLDVILNNDYIGLARVILNNSSTLYSYFNGNHFTINQYSSIGNPFNNVSISFESIVLNDKYQGTPESAESVIEVTDKNDEFNEQAGDLYDYEGQFNEDLNDSLEDIQIDFDIGTQFGSKFLASANWVKSQFDTLTSNTPFGTVLSFSLVLGIALLIIGKAIK